jgi:hypothetical protein
MSRDDRDTPSGRREFGKRMAARRYEQDEEAYKKVRRGWCLGDAEFRKELLERMEGGAGENHENHEKREMDELKAERIVCEQLKKLAGTNAILESKRKGDPQKVEIVRRLREETTMTLEWVAAVLHMGSWTMFPI